VSILEQSAVGPSHYKVAMVTKTSGISVRKSEFSVSVGTSVEEKLVENGYESNRVRLRAHTSVKITNCRVRHMTFMICRVKVDSIPARGEVYLGSHRVALTRREPVVLYRTTIKNTHYMDRSVCNIGVVLSSSKRVTGDHPESIGKSHGYLGLVASLDTWSVVASPLLIVNRGTFPMDHLPRFVCPLVVQLRDPVVAVVDCVVAGGFVGLGGVHWSHGATEGVTAGYAVNVGGGDTRLDDGV